MATDNLLKKESPLAYWACIILAILSLGPWTISTFIFFFPQYKNDYLSNIHDFFINYSGLFLNIVSIIIGIIITFALRNEDKKRSKAAEDEKEKRELYFKEEQERRQSIIDAQNENQREIINLINKNVRDITIRQTTLSPLNELGFRYDHISRLLEIAKHNPSNHTYILSYSAMYGIVQCHNANLVVHGSEAKFYDFQEYWSIYDSLIRKYEKMKKEIRELIELRKKNVHYGLLTGPSYHTFLDQSFSDKTIVPSHNAYDEWNQLYVTGKVTLDNIYTYNIEAAVDYSKYADDYNLTGLRAEFKNYFLDKNTDAKTLFNGADIVELEFIPFQIFVTSPLEDNKGEKMGLVFFPNPQKQGRIQGGIVGFETKDESLIDSLIATFNGLISTKVTKES